MYCAQYLVQLGQLPYYRQGSVLVMVRCRSLIPQVPARIWYSVRLSGLAQYLPSEMAWEALMTAGYWQRLIEPLAHRHLPRELAHF